MDFLEVVRTRRSVRAYKSQEVPPEVLDRVLDCARLAPSANNVQPWRFHIVREPALRRELAQAAADQMFIAEAPVVIVCCGRRYVDRWSWLGPHMYLVDCAIAFDHLTLAARNEGLGTCWIGAFDHERVRKLLRVPAEEDVIMLTPLGYPAAANAFHETKARRPFAEVVRGR